MFFICQELLKGPYNTLATLDKQVLLTPHFADEATYR